ncbi:nucleotidyltransferase domain-containing protein [Clostridium sp. 2-1]|nr:MULTISPECIES: nucleotidyltransferase domain-containing protein [Clostridium]MBN7573925.1 nucleotidyltransferase domain-containing protein [Clostridium beijerinckii]MBN7577605.1 nucleotidyltransferase domain-containing protein [Clostridium beijerinckii]MBN7583675.1 nucleotidyltransferase domain-containing protein [Clostridium beijerinckii]MBO0519903.1 nucleotidyltransferase domain-containing protein [Clostridium beijerinckii]POO92765.1 nucleotidyltransferase domain-containing protein [Clostr
MFGLKEIIIVNINTVLSKYDEIEKALIFGSRSRGNYKKTSDIDIAVFSHNMTSSRLNLLRNDLEELDIIYTVDVVDFYKISKEELKNNIINDGIVIFDRNSIQQQVQSCFPRKGDRQL